MAMDPGERIQVRFKLNGAERERAVVIGGDLEYLQTLPRDRLLTHTEVRLAAGVLRRLLVDDELGRLWRTFQPPAGVRPTIEATEIDTALSIWPQKWIHYAWAGGANANQAHHAGMIVAAIPQAEHEKYESVDAFLEANPMPFRAELKRMTVKDWLRSTSVAIQTNNLGLVRISRAAVLKYAANRKGGVHFDPDRTLVKNPSKSRRTAESRLLDHGLLRVGHLSGPEFEVASMVQAVASADWADEIVGLAQAAAPEDFHGDPQELKFWSGRQEADGTGWATSRFSPAADPD